MYNGSNNKNLYFAHVQYSGEWMVLHVVIQGPRRLPSGDFAVLLDLVVICIELVEEEKKRLWSRDACLLKRLGPEVAHITPGSTLQWEWVMRLYLTAKGVGTGFPWLGSCFPLQLYVMKWENGFWWVVSATSSSSQSYLFRGGSGVGQIVGRVLEFLSGSWAKPVTPR